MNFKSTPVRIKRTPTPSESERGISFSFVGALGFVVALPLGFH